jgi:hypothetical protein
MRDFMGGAPTIYTIGSAIAANDANYIIISTSSGSSSPSSSAAASAGTRTVKAVPFEHAWLLALFIGVYAVYTIVQRGR